MAWTNKSKNATTFTNEGKNSATFTNKSKGGGSVSAFKLLIGGAYHLLIDATNKLLIQSASPGTTWNNKTKN